MHPQPTPVRVTLTPPQAVEATSALVWPAARPDAARVILAHGAGTHMGHRHMQRHATDLAAAGVGVALFDFAYTAAGRSRPDPAPRLEQAWRDVVTALPAHLGGRGPVVIGGRSMGGRIASIVAAADAEALGIAGVACIAYPLHPPGRPDRLRVAHWPDLRVPILLVSGSRDAMAPLDALRANVAAHLAPGLATVHVVEGADHSFRARTADGRTEDEVLAEVAQAVTGWLATALAPDGPGPAGPRAADPRAAG
jgi:predicted alpha/beta-hydrolase family hydrolase